MIFEKNVKIRELLFPSLIYQIHAALLRNTHAIQCIERIHPALSGSCLAVFSISIIETLSS